MLKGDLKDKEKNFLKDFILFSIPVWLQYILSNIMYILDNVMVSNLCSEAVTAIGIIYNINGVPYKAVTGLLLGTRAFSLQALRLNDRDKLKKIIAIRFLLVVVISIGYIVVVYTPLIDKILSAYMQSTESTLNADLVMQLAKDYVNIIVIQFFIGTLSRTILSTLKEFGKGKSLVVVTLSSTLLGVLLNWLLIYGNCGLPTLGVKGAAIATLMASGLEILICIFMLKKEKIQILKLNILKIYTEVVKDLSYVYQMSKHCIPIVISYICSRFVYVYIQQCYSSYSLDYLTAIGITHTVVEFIFIFGCAMNEAANILINKSNSPLKIKREQLGGIRKFTLKVYLCAIPLVSTLSVLVLHYLYEVSDVVVGYGEIFIIIYSITYVIELFSNLEYLTLMNMQRTKETTIINSISYLVLDLPLSIILTKILGLNVFLVFVLLKSCHIIRLVYGRVKVNYYYKREIAKHG